MVIRMMLIIAGGAAFWMPVAALIVFSKDDFRLTLANILPVVTSICLYWALVRAKRFREVKLLPLYMLAGIYVFGPVSITLATSAVKGGFPTLQVSGHDLYWLTLTSLIPPLTMLFVGDSGIILGMIGITILFIFASVKRGRSWNSGQRTQIPGSSSI